VVPVIASAGVERAEAAPTRTGALHVVPDEVVEDSASPAARNTATKPAPSAATAGPLAALAPATACVVHAPDVWIAALSCVSSPETIATCPAHDGEVSAAASMGGESWS